MLVQCDFMTVMDNYYGCMIEKGIVSHPETEIIEVKGKHEVGRTNLDVKGVKFDGLTLSYFPKSLNKLFVNITLLNIESGGLETFSRKDLKGLENLEMLLLPHNKLTSLPNNLFHDMKKLNYVSFSGNKLEAMTSRLLEPIKSGLKFAGFSNNTKIDAFFNSEVPGSVTLYSYDIPRSKTLAQLMELIDTNCDASKVKYPKQQYKENIKAGFGDLWESRCFSDFTIIADTKEFAVHKNILGIQSSVFSAIFENDMKERNEGKMEIEEFSLAAVEEFLRCLYTGEIQNDSNAMELFALAAKYDVPDIKLITEEMVLDNIDEKNALEVLNLGNLYGSEELKTEAFDEIQKIFPEFILPEKLKDEPEKVLKLIEGKRNFKRKIQEADEEQKQEEAELAEKLKQAKELGKIKKEAANKEFDLLLETKKLKVIKCQI